MAGYVYMNDLAQLGQSTAEQATKLESGAAALEQNAANLDKTAATLPAASATGLRQQSATFRSQAATMRAQATALRSQVSTGGGVTGKDALDVLNTALTGGAQVGAALLAAKAAGKSGTPVPGAETTATNTSSSSGGGIGVGGMLAIVGVGAAATIFAVSQMMKPKTPVRNRKRH